MRMSDIVAQYIKEMLDNQNGNAEIQRNELAEALGCVPSQINYVITSRFTQEQGYIVESRRGGGGYIRITRINLKDSSGIMHIVNSIGSTIDYTTSAVLLKNMVAQGALSPQSAKLMLSAISDRAYAPIPPQLKDILRASVLKNMLLTVM